MSYANPNNCSAGWVWNATNYNCTQVVAPPTPPQPTPTPTPVCVNGFFNGRYCESNNPNYNGICPIGYFWDGTNCTTTFGTCNTGYTITFDGSCASTTVRCPTSYYYDAGQSSCFLITSASCPSGYYWTGQKCQLFNNVGSVQTCLTNYIYSFASQSCIPNAVSSSNPVCLQGTWNGRWCATN